MSAITPRLAWQSFCSLGSAIITVSSNQSTYPPVKLKDQHPGITWRSKVGWNIITGYNDAFDFTEGSNGDASATLTAGNYATPALMATQLQTQINAAATDNTYTVTYSTTTYKFTIARSTGSDTFGLEHNTGSNAATSCSLDLGFLVAADDTGALTYTADSASYKSREYIVIDTGAVRDVKAVGFYGHNLTSTSTVTIEADSTTTFTPDYGQTAVSGTGALRFIWITEQSYRYWRFVINDTDNSDGYTEVGVPWLSSYTEPTRGIEQRYREPRGELSNISFADQGAHYVDIKRTRKGYNVRFLQLPSNDRTAMISFADFVVNGRNFFFGLDPLNNPITDTTYMFLTSPMGLSESPYARFDISLSMAAALS